jgi:3-oxoadipate enol-lactonase
MIVQLPRAAAVGRLRRMVLRLRRRDTPRFARNGPVAIAYEVRGRGSPLVLIQGLGVGRWGWEPVVDQLARRFQVITIDNRGVGASDAPAEGYTPLTMAEDVCAVLDDAGIERACVVGISLGGMVAQELTLAHPSRVDKLVLVSTIPGRSISPSMPMETAYLFAVAPLMPTEQRLETFVNTGLSPETQRRRPKVARRLAALKRAHPQSEHAWRAQATAGMRFDPLGMQRHIVQPTLIIQGTADQVVNPHNARVLAALIPHASVEFFDGAGHLVHWEEPQRFVQVVTEFLTSPAVPSPVVSSAAGRQRDADAGGVVRRTTPRGAGVNRKRRLAELRAVAESTRRPSRRTALRILRRLSRRKRRRAANHPRADQG